MLRFCAGREFHWDPDIDIGSEAAQSPEILSTPSENTESTDLTTGS